MNDLLSKLYPYWVEVLVLSGLLVFVIVMLWVKPWRIKSIRGEPVKDLSFHQPAEPDLMGKVRLDEGVIEVPVSELRFLVSGTGAGLVADAIAELKVIFQQLAAGDKGKVDFFREMIGVEEKYEELFSHPGLGEVRQFIKSHAPFALSREELTGFWG